MARRPISAWCFALAVVRKGDRFLLVHEHKHGRPWYLPAGGVDPGETFQEAAVRETLEEAGIPIRLTGVIRIEHSPERGGDRFRVIFAGEPIDDTPPKSIPDEESLEAAWVSIDELDRYTLRGTEVKELMRYLLDGGPIYPLELLQLEGRPYLVIKDR